MELLTFGWWLFLFYESCSATKVVPKPILKSEISFPTVPKLGKKVDLHCIISNNNVMIYKIISSTLLLIIMISTGSSQKIIKKGSTYTYNDTTYYNYTDLANIMRSNIEAKAEFDFFISKKKTANTASIFETLFLIGGIGTAVYYSNNDCLEGHCIPGVMAGGLIGTIGVGFYIGALVNDKKSYSHIHKALDIFNEDSTISQNQESIQFQLATTANGVGIVLIF